MSETARQAAADVMAEINGMTFLEHDGNEGWSEKVRPVIERAIEKAQWRGFTEVYPLLREDNAELRLALTESLKLQSHYAALLNDYDGGGRMRFATVEAWMDRLTALKPKEKPE